MLQITERAADELTRLLTQTMHGARQSVRLGLKPSGGLAMTIDVPHPGDTLVRRNEAVLLIVEGRLLEVGAGDLRLETRDRNRRRTVTLPRGDVVAARIVVDI